jgi:ribosome recycling factor
MSQMPLQVFEVKMSKSLDALKSELINIRAGRANPALLDRVQVEYYGALTPISQLASISVPEARVIIISPWDMKVVKEIERALLKSDIGITPNSDGKVLRLVFPQLTEDRRKDLVKVIKKFGEEGKIQIRTIRREAVDAAKASKKASDLTEDDLKVVEKDIQHLTDKYIVKIEKLVEIKEQEILEV